jgi:conjugative transposon TraN protein
MKNKFIRIAILFMLQAKITIGQDHVAKPVAIEPYKITVSYNRTSNLIFPYDIKSVDRGSIDILAQKAKNIENILQIKASRPDMQPTDLTVITTDGHFYSFLVEYEIDPLILNWSFKGTGSKDSVLAKLEDGTNEAMLVADANTVGHEAQFMRIGTNQQKIQLSLTALYLLHDRLWFNFKLKNKSEISYHPEYIRFTISDKKKSKRTAIQEWEMTPIYKVVPHTIAGKTTCNLLMGFQAFTIPTDKLFIIQIGEHKGSRSLLLKINGKQLFRARDSKPH